jgi:hypothetical protein
MIKVIKGNDGRYWWTTEENPTAMNYSGEAPRHARGFETEQQAREAAKATLQARARAMVERSYR